jgi:hypothetical protein
MIPDDQIVFVGAVPDELTDWEKQTVAASALQMIWVDEVKENPARAAQKALSSLEDRVDRILIHFPHGMVTHGKLGPVRCHAAARVRAAGWARGTCHLLAG